MVNSSETTRDALEAKYGSGRFVSLPPMDRNDYVYTEIVSMFSETSEQGDLTDGTRSADEALNPEVVEQLFTTLQRNLTLAETDEAAKQQWERIKESLRKNSGKMRTIHMYLRDHGEGAKLTVIVFQDQEGGERYVEFAEAGKRDRESVMRQVAIFNRLTAEQKNAAIEGVIEADSAKLKTAYTDEQKQRLRAKLSSECKVNLSPGDGLNFWQALAYVAHYEGRLPSYQDDRAMAEKNTKLSDNAWTWRDGEGQSLLRILESDSAPFGDRVGDGAFRGEDVASNRCDFRGGCVAGLRVPLGA